MIVFEFRLTTFLLSMIFFNSKEFIEDLKKQIENFKNLIKQQEISNEKFSKENELLLIDDDQKQLNEAKLNYLKNELQKLTGNLKVVLLMLDMMI
jgi:hypothetical protein